MARGPALALQLIVAVLKIVSKDMFFVARRFFLSITSVLRTLSAIAQQCTALQAAEEKQNKT